MQAHRYRSAADGFFQRHSLRTGVERDDGALLVAPLGKDFVAQLAHIGNVNSFRRFGPNLIAACALSGPCSADLSLRGQALWIALMQAIVVGVSLALLARQLTVDTVVADGELRGRGIFSPMVRVPLDTIASVDVVPVYVGQSPETVPQLLVRDAEGRRLFRLRGTFWHADDLTKVMDALPVPAQIVTEPMSFPEFFAAYPGSAYWFENRPWLMAGLLALVIVACIGIGVSVMVLLGMPIMA